MVRLATMDDIEKAISSVVGFMAESAYAPFDIEKSVEAWRTFIASGIGAIFILDDFSGALGGLCTPDCHGHSMVATEFFWYVQPDKRGSGRELLLAFEEWASVEGADRIIMTHLADSMPEKLKSFYLRNGYKELETNYVKEVN